MHIWKLHSGLTLETAIGFSEKLLTALNIRWTAEQKEGASYKKESKSLSVAPFLFFPGCNVIKELGPWGTHE